MIKTLQNGDRLELYSPTALPKASAFLWNKKMMIQVNCRGYAVSQFLQPEPAKYSHAPNLEAKTFMQPEQAYYAHHPGRFCYVKDEISNQIFSAPYEPCRSKFDKFVFSVGKSDITWQVENNGILVEMNLSLTKDDVVELWKIKVKNLTPEKRHISIYPYFTVGYMSWMNQSGEYKKELNGIVCNSISPYQKYQDYDKVKDYKDKTFLLADKQPAAWEVNQESFEGEGGLHNPSSLLNKELTRSNAVYETPVCVMQYRTILEPEEENEYMFLFGPANNETEIKELRQKFFLNESENNFASAQKEYSEYIRSGKGSIKIKTPDSEFDNFVNNWLPRQIYYHGETNRFCTDPQTRNYFQDYMGMSYINSSASRKAFLLALSQQNKNGAMPDGILIHQDAELKYINQVPHTDHNVWLPICLQAYLDETDDYGLLNEKVKFLDSDETATVSRHIDLAMLWLINDRDDRGLSYIKQGDWCDPMNMVGVKGKGVSGWLSLATIYTLQIWSEIKIRNNDLDLVDKYLKTADEIKASVNKHLWDGDWFARGITDDNKKFGIANDKFGRIFLNPQAWAFLAKIVSESQKEKIIQSVKNNLESPFGVEMLAPSFTSMREDIGRVTQKHPGSAENGSVYNHAATFFIYSLYGAGEKEYAFSLLRKMIPGSDKKDLIQRGQLPVFVPNYYRGAYKQFPETAGRSSQLFNTGTVHWYYRIVIECLLGLKGTRDGLSINPRLPSFWSEVQVQRIFRNATFNISIYKDENIPELTVEVNEKLLDEPIITNIISGEHYNVKVRIP